MNRRGRGEASPFCSMDDIDSCPLRHVTFYDRYRAVNDFSRRDDTSRIHPRFVSPPSPERNDGPPTAVLSTAEIIYFFLFFFFLPLENYQSHSCFLVTRASSQFPYAGSPC